MKNFSLDFLLVFSVDRDLTILFISCFIFLKDARLVSVYHRVYSLPACTPGVQAHIAAWVSFPTHILPQLLPCFQPLGSLPSGQTTPLWVHVAWSAASSPVAMPLYLTSTPDTDQWWAQTTGVTPFWLQTEYLLWIPKEGIFLPSLCITNSYSSFGSRVETSLLQDRSSGSPGMGGTLLCFPTSLCFYLLWPWAPWTVSISQSPLSGLEVPKAAFQHQYDMLEKWRLASWMNEWVVWVPNMCRVEHCQFKSVGRASEMKLKTSGTI